MVDNLVNNLKLNCMIICSGNICHKAIYLLLISMVTSLTAFITHCSGVIVVIPVSPRVLFMALSCSSKQRKLKSE